MKNRRIVSKEFTAKSLFRNKLFRKIVATWCAFATLVTTSAPAFAATTYSAFDSVLNNVSGNVTATDFAGNGIAGASDVTVLNIDTTAGGVGVLDWGKLNVPGGTTMNFGDTVGGTFYNIVDSAGGMTAIAGALNGANNANVWIFNPAGIAINNGAAINVQGVFGAIAAGVANKDDILADPTIDISAGTVKGNITVDGGKVSSAETYFLGKNVTIDGTADADNLNFAAGDVKIVAGNAIQIDSVGGGSISVNNTASTAGKVDLMGQFANNLAVDAGKNVKVNGDLTVAKDFSAKSQTGFFQNDAAVSAKSIDVNVAGNVNANKALTATDGDVTLKATGDGKSVKVVEGITATGDVTLDGKKSAQVKGGTITAKNVSATGEEYVTVKDGAAIVAAGDVELKQTTGTSISGDTFDGESAGVYVAGDVTATGDVAVDAAGTVKVGTYLKGTEAEAPTSDAAVSGANVTLKQADAAGALDIVEGASVEATTQVTLDNAGDKTGTGLIKGDVDYKGAGTVKEIGFDFDGNDHAFSAAENTALANLETLAIDNAKTLTLSADLSVNGGTIKGAAGEDVTIAGGKTFSVAGDLGVEADTGKEFVQDGGTIAITGNLTADTFRQKNGGAMSAAEIKADVIQDGCVINTAKIDGNLTQNAADSVVNGKGGTGKNDLEITGDLSQTVAGAQVNAGAIGDGGTLTLKGAATQVAGAVVTADTLNLAGDGTQVVALDSTANEIAQVGGTAKSVKLVTKTDITVNDLDTKTVSDGNVSITANDGTSDKNITLTGANKANKLTLAGAKVVGTAGTVEAAEVALTASDDVTLDQDNKVAKVGGTAKNLKLVNDSTSLEIGDLTVNTADIKTKTSGDITIADGKTLTVTKSDNGADEATLKLDAAGDIKANTGAIWNQGAADSVATDLKAGGKIDLKGDNKFFTAAGSEADDTTWNYIVASANGGMKIKNAHWDKYELNIAGTDWNYGDNLDARKVIDIWDATGGGSITVDSGKHLAVKKGTTEGGEGIHLGANAKRDTATSDNVTAINLNGDLSAAGGDVKLWAETTQAAAGVITADNLVLASDGDTTDLQNFDLKGANKIGTLQSADKSKQVGTVTLNNVQTLTLGDITAGKLDVTVNAPAVDPARDLVFAGTVKTLDAAPANASSFKSVNGNVVSTGTASELDAAGDVTITAESLFGGNVDMNTKFTTAEGKTLTVNANTLQGKATLKNSDSVFKGTVEGSAFDIDIAANKAALGNLEAKNSIKVVASGEGANISVVKGKTVGAGDGIALTGGDITVAGSVVAKGGDLKLNAQAAGTTDPVLGNVVVENDGISAGKIQQKGNDGLEIKAANDITVKGSVVNDGNGKTTLDASKSIAVEKGTTPSAYAGSIAANGTGALEIKSGTGITTDGAVSTLGGDLTMTATTGDITLNAATTSKGALSATATAGDIKGSGNLQGQTDATLIAGKGVDMAGDVKSMTGNLTAKANNGGVKIGGVAYAGQNASFTAKGANVANIDVNQAGNTFIGNITADAGTKDVLLQNTAATKFASVNANKLTLTSGGAVTQTGKMTIADTVEITATANNDVVLNHEDNEFSTVKINSARDVFVTDKDASDNALNLDAITANKLDITAGGAVTQTGVATIETTTAIDATGKDVTLDQANAFKGVVSVKGADVEIDNTVQDLKLGNITATGDFSASTASGKKITATSDYTVKAAGDVTLTGDKEINIAKADFAAAKTLTVNGTGADVTVDNANGLTLGVVGAKMLNLSAGGDVAQNGVATVTGAATIDATGYNVTLDQANKLGGAVSVQGNDVTVNNDQALKFGNVVATKLTATAKGAISQEDLTAISVSGGGAASFTAKDTAPDPDVTYDITVANDNNEFTGTVTADGANVTIKDQNNLTLGNVTATGKASVTAGDNLTVNGAVSAEDDTALSATVGNLAVNGVLTSDGNATLTAGKKLTGPATSSITVKNSKELALNAGADGIDYKGKIVATGKTKFNTTGDVVLENTASTFADDVYGNGKDVTLKANELQLGTMTVNSLTATTVKDGLTQAKDLTVNGAIGATTKAKLQAGDNATDGDTTASLVFNNGTSLTAATVDLKAAKDIKNNSGEALVKAESGALEAETGEITLEKFDIKTIDYAKAVKGNIVFTDVGANPLTISTMKAGGKIDITKNQKNIEVAKDAVVESGLDLAAADKSMKFTLKDGAFSFLGGGSGYMKAPGTLTIDAKNDITLHGKILAEATGLAANLKSEGNVIADNTANNFVGYVTAESAPAGSITLTDVDDLTLGVIKGKDAILTADKGKIAMNGTDKAEVDTLAATAKSITFVNGSGTADSKDIHLVGISQTGTADGDVLKISAQGDITQNSPVLASGPATFEAKKGDARFDVLLKDSSNNNFKNVVNVTAAKSVAIMDKDGLVLGNIDASGNLEATASGVDAGNLTQADGTVIKVEGTTTLLNNTKDTGAINVVGANKMKGALTASAKNDITVRNDMKLIVDQVGSTEGNVRLFTTADSTPAFSTASSYTAGDEVVKDGTYYKANVAVASGAWDASQWDAAGSDIEVRDNTKVVEATAGSVTLEAFNNLLVGGVLKSKYGFDLKAGWNQATTPAYRTDADGSATLAGTSVFTFLDNGSVANLSVKANNNVTIAKPDGDTPTGSANKIFVENGKIDVETKLGNIKSSRVLETKKSGSATDTSVKFAAGNDIKVDNAITANDNKIDFKAGNDITVEKSASPSLLAKDGALLVAKTQAKFVAGNDINVLDQSLVQGKGIGVATTDNTVDFVAGNDILVDGNASANYAQVVAGDFTMTPGVEPSPASTDKSKLYFEAGKNVTVQDNAAVGAAGTMRVLAKDGDVTVQDTAYLLAADNMTVDAEDAGAGAGSILVANNGNILTYGMLTATAEKDVTVKAATADSFVKAVGDATVTAKSGSITIGDTAGADQSQVRADGNLKLDAQNGGVTI